jgi:hypothetical protein
VVPDPPIRHKTRSGYRIFDTMKVFPFIGFVISIAVVSCPKANGTLQGSPGENKNSSSTEEFAPGYPNYSVTQLNQLEAFPLPRYKPGSKLRRNFPWYDFLYTAYNYGQVDTIEGRLVYRNWNTRMHGDSAILLEKELYDHWNYYFNIPTPTYNANEYAKAKSFSGRIAAYANEHPEMQTCTYIFWPGVRPKDAGYGSQTAYIKTNAAIDPCSEKSGYPNIVKDGVTQRFYLRKLFKALSARDSLRKIDFINENGEKFGESWTPNAEGYKGTPFIACIQPDSVSQERARFMRAEWQYKVFNAYKTQIIGHDSLTGAMRSDFSFYQVSAFLPEYYAEYEVMRKINSAFNNAYYSTPDFYPGEATHNIFDRYAAYHGLNSMIEGREAEIALGDRYFSPFVCAGWFADSMNYRPAAWLGALKALGMMGADFYYAGYFNTVNPSKQLPQDPRGYIYQLALPSYAQAITSRYEDIFFNSSGFDYWKENDCLCIWRKDANPDRYVIYTCYFPPFGSKQVEKTNEVNIGGNKMVLKFPLQGGTYIYDKANYSGAVFYQLDAWHETSHPYFWSKDFQFEAELTDGESPALQTERFTEDEADFTTFTTFVAFASKDALKVPMVYHFETRKTAPGACAVWIRARSIGKESSAEISLNGKKYQIDHIANANFAWYPIAIPDGTILGLRLPSGSSHELTVKAGDTGLQVDKIFVSLNGAKPEME